MILRDSILDAETVKVVLESLIRRAHAYGKSREDILMELNFIVDDVKKSIDTMDNQMSKEAA